MEKQIVTLVFGGKTVSATTFGETQGDKLVAFVGGLRVLVPTSALRG